MSRRNRPIKITFRVSEAELSEIERLCQFSGMNTSDLVRMAVLTAKVIPADIPLMDQASFVELKRIGNNFNQIARGINANAIDYDTLRTKMESIQACLDLLTSYLINHDSKH